MPRYETRVKSIYPNATCHCFQINNWRKWYIIGKTSKSFTQCDDDDDFLTADAYKSEEEAWEEASKVAIAEHEKNIENIKTEGLSDVARSAIEFADWISENRFVTSQNNTKGWYQMEHISLPEISTMELYDKYIKSKNEL